MSKAEDEILRKHYDKQVKTRKKKYGDDFYSKMGKKGGKNNPRKFNSETGKAAARKRWERKKGNRGKGA